MFQNYISLQTPNIALGGGGGAVPDFVDKIIWHNTEEIFKSYHTAI